VLQQAPKPLPVQVALFAVIGSHDPSVDTGAVSLSDSVQAPGQHRLQRNGPQCRHTSLNLLHHELNVLSGHVEFRAELIPHVPSVEML
jgi:hypothetical protein